MGLRTNFLFQENARNGMEQTKCIYLAHPHGMCAGVRRALETVSAVLERFGSPVFVLHEIVHNSLIVNALLEQGVRFADSLDEVPSGARLLFSAHGVSSSVEEEASRRGFQPIDATCPLVKKLHHAAEEANDVLILLGHRGHPEVEGTLGRSGARRTFLVGRKEELAALPSFSDEMQIMLLAQTTLNREEVHAMELLLRERYPHLESAATVCYATTNRQKAMRLLTEKTGTVLVIGSPHSSNSNRLREIAEQAGAEAFLVERAEELPREPLLSAASVGIGAGASAPEYLVQQVIRELDRFGFGRIEPVCAAKETVRFPLPKIPDPLLNAARFRQIR